MLSWPRAKKSKILTSYPGWEPKNRKFSQVILAESQKIENIHKLSWPRAKKSKIFTCYPFKISNLKNVRQKVKKSWAKKLKNLEQKILNFPKKFKKSYPKIQKSRAKKSNFVGQKVETKRHVGLVRRNCGYLYWLGLIRSLIVLN